jgi:hypothetical protein
VTDAGLKGDVRLQSLQMLNLTEAQITDAGLRELAALKSLRMLDLTDTSVAGDLRFLVTDTGVAELRKALPGLKSIR